MRSTIVKTFILDQFHREHAQAELKALGGNVHYDWVTRTQTTIDDFCEIACDLAAYIVDTVPSRLNSAIILEDLVNAHLFHNNSDWVKDIKRHATILRELSANLESQQVSAEIQRQVEHFPGFSGKIYSNGNSIFPDFIYKHFDYSLLSLQNRKKTVHGPCLQGKAAPRPSNVPDGIELKTNKGTRMRIDAHAPHCGLHLGFTWDFSNDGRVEINGAWIGYIAGADHRESARNSKTTTIKFSFGHERFISLL